MLEIIRYETASAHWLWIAINGMRNSWESHEKGDSRTWYHAPNDQGGAFELGDADRTLLHKLIRAGQDHSKVLRQLPIIMDIKAPNYFWKEFDTYRVGVAYGDDDGSDVTQNSTSQMHVLGKYPFSADMFSWEDIDQLGIDAMLTLLNYLRDRWIDEGGKAKGPNAYCWRAMVQAIPDSWNYTRTVTANYQVLRSIYHARKAHRLSEWRTFCEWLTTLPYSELITMEGR